MYSVFGAAKRSLRAHCYPSLTFLSLLGNPACPDQISNPDKDDDDDYQRYRYFVIHKLRHLKFLDSRAVSNAERAESRRVGPSCVSPGPRCTSGPCGRTCRTPRTTATPASRRCPQHGVGQQRKTVYGMLKYKYTGKHSEGNRFIRNDEL
ncbi:hypothetical protein HPB48_015303 [Haemaphysalis longicornis]|uniref:Uncharacterized protein n=1 Tax=Haemaphysalis longicornis TaxID=44386 RepID=A0A9J6GJN9_HAELO|nr:hypothetical protein HPB48_015303 [Haemaphysalis longicornis]